MDAFYRILSMAAVDTPVCNFGWKAPEFTLPDLDGSPVSMKSSMGEHGLLIAFICNHCPYVKAIIDRLVADAAELAAEGVNTVAIMSNDYRNYPADAPDKMKEFAQQHALGFPYLLDQDQSVARAYGAVCTPDFFGLNAAGELQYRGRIDDAKMADPGNRKTELLDAMRLVATTGNGPEDQVPSMGCSIKWAG
jgi:peroxiredoxin